MRCLVRARKATECRSYAPPRDRGDGDVDGVDDYDDRRQDHFQESH